MFTIKRLPNEDGEKRWRFQIYPLGIVGVILFVIVWLLVAWPARAEEYERDSGIGSYSNVYGHGWTKVCCDDYRYYRRDRSYRSHRWRSRR
jgi:hypothetical protein